MFKSPRQQVLEEFINDSVEKLTTALYRWHERYYEVLPYFETKKRHNWSGFIKTHIKEKTFMIREASNDILKKYYPKIWSREDLRKAIKHNPNLIEKY